MPTIFTTPILSPLLRKTSQAILKLSGWEVVGEIPPELKHCVVIGAPHTTNWDLPTSLLLAFALNAEMQWVGKASIFRFPFGTLMRFMSGIPVDRSKSGNMVTATVEKFKSEPVLRLLMAPEGTRAQAEQWKTGFYYIAHGAQVPIAMAFVDYKKRRGGIGGVFKTTGDYVADLGAIQAAYQMF